MSEPKVVETISLCDGWKVCFTNPLELHTFKNGEYQQVRELLELDVNSEEWEIITRELFCFGHIDFDITENNKKRHCRIEVF